ncbi:RodZ domain-containing protein [Modicisalibacter luteus]|uniref:RodZ domain-containing protein n=1 Tax=Modicisalibacter luteus TaxID=453962 RepID=A0ABV7LWW0_9GAMM|nr:RodZ domain-containing protein [Halomonas lutea]GHB10988.1 helix-turn-helix domain-containing protein [Halomonas lutea]
MSEAQERQEASFDPTGHTSPGQQLRRERERQGLGLEEVAVQLNLRPAVVAGLEEDRYDEVPIPAYRRGYLRAYARLMGIDERQIVEAYNSQYGQGDLDRKVTPVNVTKPPSKLGAWVFKLVTLLVILGLIGLTLLWWQSRNGNELMEGLGLSDSVEVSPMGEQTANGTLTQAEPAAGESESSALPPLPEENNELGLVDDESATTADEAPTPSTDEPDTDTPEPTPATADSEAAEAAASNAEAASNPSAPSDDAAQPATTNASDSTPEATAAASAEAQEPTQAEAPAVNNRRLAFTFNEQSWTEIYDANGQRILVGLQSPGTEATVEGDPPFRLTIGNASGVELRYRGEPVDLRARAGGNNVARFTLGE